MAYTFFDIIVSLWPYANSTVLCHQMCGQETLYYSLVQCGIWPVKLGLIEERFAQQHWSSILIWQLINYTTPSVQECLGCFSFKTCSSWRYKVCSLVESYECSCTILCKGSGQTKEAVDWTEAFLSWSILPCLWAHVAILFVEKKILNYSVFGGLGLWIFMTILSWD